MLKVGESYQSKVIGLDYKGDGIINLLDNYIYEPGALEGELGPAECVHDTISECTKEDGCATKLVLIKIKDSIDEVIDGITLEDMVNDVKNMKMKL